MFLGLFAVLIIVLALPFFVKKVEEELEVFLFVMGCLAVTLTSQWEMHLVREALLEPVKITIGVFVAGLLFRVFQQPLTHNVNRMVKAVGLKTFVFCMIVLLGISSSMITAIIAALVLVEIVTSLSLNRKDEIFLVVLSCFSIGLGASLTPIGEPLSTIAIAKLKGAPYHAGFFFLFDHLWMYVIPGVLACGFLGAFMTPVRTDGAAGLASTRNENLGDIFLRTFKVYLFVMALVFLGTGFKPIIDAYISKIPFQGLYWINMISAVLDNATLAAAEIGPGMNMIQIKAALLGLLISGGMLIPGNIPNIISAGKLKIKSSEWAKVGIPMGLVAMVLYFFVILMV